LGNPVESPFPHIKMTASVLEKGPQEGKGEQLEKEEGEAAYRKEELVLKGSEG